MEKEQRTRAQIKQAQSGGGVPWATEANAEQYAPKQQSRRDVAPAPFHQADTPNAARDGNGVDAMKRRPGAGQANRQTYNFFTGE